MLYANGKLEVIEVNGQPMIPDMWFDACAQTIGMNRRDYCLAIFYAGLKRYIKVNALHWLYQINWKVICVLGDKEVDSINYFYQTIFNRTYINNKLRLEPLD
jgi:hypothetical protein